MIAFEDLIEGGLRAVPQLFDVGLPVESDHQTRKSLHGLDVGRKIDIAEPVIEIRRALHGERKGDVLAEVIGGVFLVMTADEVSQVLQDRQFLSRELLAHRHSQGMIRRRGQVRVVAARVDGGEHGEQGQTPVKLSMLLGGAR